MRTIGVIGGMSWESSALYYQAMNRQVRERLGGLHSADVLLHSLDFAPIEQAQAEDRWDVAAEVLIASARALERAGAQCCVIATNTMHKVANEVQAAISIPLLHIADATGSKLVSDSRCSPLLLGTKFTMEENFYKQKLREDYSMNVVIPNQHERELIHRIIYQELCQGVVSRVSKDQVTQIILRIESDAIDSVVLGCTELPLLFDESELTLPIYDTTQLHVEAAIQFALHS